MLRWVSLAGLACMIGLAWTVSEHRRKVDWRLVLWGVILQFAVGLLMLRTPLEAPTFAGMKKVVEGLTSVTLEGAGFVFGNLTQVLVIKRDAVPNAEADLVINAVVAFQVLPIIVFVSALSAILYHLRVIQTVVRVIAWAMRRTLGTSGAETFGAALLIFLGIESMTALRAYLKSMTRSELCTLMTAFMATIAGSVMVVYAAFGAEPGHLLAASLMSAPAAILVSKIMVPETEEPQTRGAARIAVPVESLNVMDAAARGTADGLQLALHVGAMLIAFIALVALGNRVTAWLTGYSLERLMGYVFWPFALMMGVPPGDAAGVGELLGMKTILNEFIAYQRLGEMIRSGALSARSITVATYALCGFANPGSLGILIAGLVGLAPERRSDIVRLGVRALAGGTLACFITACVAGVLMHG